MRRFTAVLGAAAIGTGVVAAALVSTADARRAKYPVREMPAFTTAADAISLPAAGRGAVGLVALDGDPVGPGPEYEALRVMGVPAQVTTLADDLSRFPVVILAGAADARLDDATAARLDAYVAAGGSLIAEAATAPSLRPLLGIASVVESQSRQSLTICAACDPSLGDVTTTAERVIQLDDQQSGDGIGTVGYVAAADAGVLATFDDGTAAVLARRHGKGTAYTVGARLSDLITRHLEGARFSAKRQYVNSADADVDAWLLWLRGVWRTASPGGVTLSTLPAGVTAQVVMTLSANWGTGITQAPEYVDALREAAPGARSTVFVATHTRRDWLDTGYFATPRTLDPDAAGDALDKISAMGSELGSHSVSHSPSFASLAVGTGNETWETYRPFVANRTRTRGATLLGELVVSRALLHQFQAPVVSFRSPYLTAPRRLAPAEDVVGYRYDSSTTQGWVQTAFPFHPPRLDDRGFADVISLPIAVEDEQRGGLEARVSQAVEVVAQNAANGAPATVLVHPVDQGDRRAAMAKLVGALRERYGRGLSVDSVAGFGAFWWQRERLALMVGPSDRTGQCGAGVAGVRIAVGNRSGEWAVRQSLTVADPNLHSAVIRTGRSVVYPKVVNGALALPAIRPNRTIVGVLCP